MMETVDYTLLNASRDGDLLTVQKRLADDHVDLSLRDMRRHFSPEFMYTIRPGTLYTALHYAAHKGHVEIVQVLVDHGADLEARSRNGRTPLHLAAIQGHVDVVEVLLKSAANMNAMDESGRTPLHCAARCHRRLATIDMLLSVGADPNTVTSHGQTPLHCIGNSGNVRVLLAYGADLFATNSSGREPLHELVFDSSASFRETQALVQVMVEHGAAWDAQCEALRTERRARHLDRTHRNCMFRWTEDYLHGRAMVPIPDEIHGSESMWAYLEKLEDAEEEHT